MLKKILKRVLYILLVFFLAGGGILWYIQKHEDSQIQKRVEHIYVIYHLNDFECIENENYGTYLSFATQEDFIELFEYLEHFETGELPRGGEIYQDKTALDKREGTIKNFSSLRNQQKKLPFEQKYSSPAFATLLNKNGYIEVGGVLYHDIGDKIFIVKNGQEQLFFDQNSPQGTDSCKKGHDDGTVCRCDRNDKKGEQKEIKYGENIFQVQVILDRWKQYITGENRLYMKIFTKVVNANGKQIRPDITYKIGKHHKMRLEDENSYSHTEGMSYRTLNRQGGIVFEELLGPHDRESKNICIEYFDGEVELYLFTGENSLSSETIGTVNYVL